MKLKTRGASLFILTGLFASAALAVAETADTIYTGGTIITIDDGGAS